MNTQNTEYYSHCHCPYEQLSTSLCPNLPGRGVPDPAQLGHEGSTERAAGWCAGARMRVQVWARSPGGRMRGSRTSLPLPPGSGRGASTRPVPEAARPARPEPWSGRFGGPAWRGEGSRPVRFPGSLLLRLRDSEKRRDSPRRRLGAGARLSSASGARGARAGPPHRRAPGSGLRRGCRHAPRGPLLLSQTS